MDIKIVYSKTARSGYDGDERWEVEATGIDGYDGDKAVQAILDAGALMKVAAFGNAQLIVSGLKGWNDTDLDQGHG
jgi:hypothetical protein